MQLQSVEPRSTALSETWNLFCKATLNFEGTVRKYQVILKWISIWTVSESWLLENVSAKDRWPYNTGYTGFASVAIEVLDAQCERTLILHKELIRTFGDSSVSVKQPSSAACSPEVDRWTRRRLNWGSVCPASPVLTVDPSSSHPQTP